MSILIISFIILIIISFLYLISFYLIQKRSYLEKLTTYESGFEPLGNARIQFDILYWVIALLYMIFDLELIFLFPYSLILYQSQSLFGLFVIMLFLIILTLAFLYEYIRGALILK